MRRENICDKLFGPDSSARVRIAMYAAQLSGLTPFNVLFNTFCYGLNLINPGLGNFVGFLRTPIENNTRTLLEDKIGSLLRSRQHQPQDQILLREVNSEGENPDTSQAHYQSLRC